MSDKPTRNIRELEEGIATDFASSMSYADYLKLDQILTAQAPLSDEHDEKLFIVIHQASELWIKLMGDEIEFAIAKIEALDFRECFKVIARVKQILNQLTQSWNILSTLTPVDYLKFRDRLGSASGFQSAGYRRLEFLLGNKNRALLAVHKDNRAVYEELERVLKSPSLYDAVIRVLSQKGFAIDKAVLTRDPAEAYEAEPSVEAAWLAIYRDTERYFELYELAEKLVDIEDAFQQWRFRHMYTVQRIIGHKRGTGGSSGVGFLKRALDLSFFPELMAIRTKL